LQKLPSILPVAV